MANGGGKRRIEFLVTKGGLPDKFRGGDDPLRSFFSSNLCESEIGLTYLFAARRKFFLVKNLLTSKSQNIGFLRNYLVILCMIVVAVCLRCIVEQKRWKIFDEIVKVLFVKNFLISKPR